MIGSWCQWGMFVSWFVSMEQVIISWISFCLVTVSMYVCLPNYIWAPAKTSDILEQLHQDIDTWYYHETLRNDRGDAKNDDFWYTCLPDFIANIKSSGTKRDTQKTMTISATSFRGCNRFSPLLICTCISFNHFFTLYIILHVYMHSFIYGFKYVLI